MTPINWSKVLVGGLVAGVIMNVSEYVLNEPVLGAQAAEHMASLNLPPVGGSAIGVFIVMTFALAFFTIWLYAAIRPRYGAGPKTAMCAGSAVWFAAYLTPWITFAVLGFSPTDMAVIGSVWGLAELLIAAVAGAYFYQE
jgi:hypothetical protein